MRKLIDDYIIIGCEDRINESTFNLNKLIEHYNKPIIETEFKNWFPEFRYLINNYINSIASVRNVLLKDFKKKSGFIEWWERKLCLIIEFSENNLVQLRNAYFHENNGFFEYIILRETQNGRIILKLNYSYSGEQVVTKVIFKNSKIENDLTEIEEITKPLQVNSNTNISAIDEVLESNIQTEIGEMSINHYMTYKYIEDITNEINSTRLIGVYNKIESKYFTTEELMKNIIRVHKIYVEIIEEAIKVFSKY